MTTATTTFDRFSDFSTVLIEMDDLLTEMLDAYVGRVCSAFVEAAQTSDAQIPTIIEIDPLMVKAGTRAKYQFGENMGQYLDNALPGHRYIVIYSYSRRSILIEHE